MPNRLLPFFFVLSTVLCGYLSVWQLQRYFAKITEQEHKATFGPQPPATLEVFEAHPHERWSGRRLCLEGHYDPRFTFLWDNISHEGKPGYGVLNILRIEHANASTQKSLLIHRGWVARPSGARTNYPSISTPTESRVWCGTLAKPIALPFLSNTFEYPIHEGINIILDTDVPLIQKETQIALYPWVLYLDADQPGTLTLLPLPTPRVPPARHLGYALQWALLALVSIIFGHRTTKKLRNV